MSQVRSLSPLPVDFQRLRFDPDFLTRGAVSRALPGQRGTSSTMRALTFTLWLMAGLAGLGWLGTIAAAIYGLSTGTSLADSILSVLYPFLILSAISAFMIAGWQTRLGRGMGLGYWWIALLGCPSWIQTAIIWTLASTFIGVSAALWFSQDDPTAPIRNLTLLFPASIFATSAAVYVSVARMGLDKPRCPNGHVVGSDRAFCSMCGMRLD